jgi:hypothetical protein
MESTEIAPIKVVEIVPKVIEDELKALKKENAEMKGILNKLKSYVHPNHHYLYFKEKKDV